MVSLDPTKVEGPGTREVMECLNAQDFQALYVGGCVRNALMNLPIADIDISTNALPQQVMRMAQDAGFKAIPTGIDHGTVTIIVEHTPHEVTTFRRDVETDGRRAVVAYSDHIEDDARRRDFTMNALYADMSGQIIDPLGGLPDLQARVVRFIEDPDARIKEDYLRILRFFRFHAHYGNMNVGLDADGLSACAENVDGLETLSKERVGSEMKKLLSAPDPGPSIAAMSQIGVLAQILPGSDPKFLYPLVHLDQNRSPDPIRRLASLGGLNAPDALRLSKQEARQLKILQEAVSEDRGPAALGHYHGLSIAEDVLLIRKAIAGQELKLIDFDEAAKGAAAQFPVSASDLLDHYQGAALGKKLSELENRWVASDFQLTKSELLSTDNGQTKD
ncbi:CCA tRNA nucleotidyltransferase [Parasulfitobacter algicola]|uniref:CCA tRNA nucleotidyltransferase n=1 Tax=Parasulfitobacter algicola TaxID=2614809 RepID=A0ABX2IU35_9RHOB|nr:CCA tRNA nucleotidyltransferase [Sulfitobacter algicola]NSX53558.1 CCA tRNA nucleotidyltransferase [Sulfitobacter algicola]